jgi:hypothetical protein
MLRIERNGLTNRKVAKPKPVAAKPQRTTAFKNVVPGPVRN